MNSKTREEYINSFMRVGCIVGMFVGELLVPEGDEGNEIVETEKFAHQSTEHPHQSNLGEQHAAGETLHGIAFPISMDSAFNLLARNISDTGNFASMLFKVLSGEDESTNRPTETPLGTEGTSGESETTDIGNDSASR